jgi:hypothetical protein
MLSKQLVSLSRQRPLWPGTYAADAIFYNKHDAPDCNIILHNILLYKLYTKICPSNENMILNDMIDTLKLFSNRMLQHQRSV